MTKNESKKLKQYAALTTAVVATAVGASTVTTHAVHADTTTGTVSETPAENPQTPAQARDQLDAAKAEQGTVQSNFNQAQNDYNAAQGNAQTAQDQLNDGQSAYEQAQKNAQNATAENIQQAADSVTDAQQKADAAATAESKTNAQAQSDAKAASDAKSQLDDATKANDDAQSAVKDAQNNVDHAKDNAAKRDQAQSQVNDAKQAASDAQKNADSAQSAAKDAQDKADAAAKAASDAQQAVSDAQKAVDQDNENIKNIGGDHVADATKQLNDAKNKADAAQKDADAAKATNDANQSALNDAKSKEQAASHELDTKNAAESSAKQAADSAQEALNQAQDALKTAQDSQKALQDKIGVINEIHMSAEYADAMRKASHGDKTYGFITPQDSDLYNHLVNGSKSSLEMDHLYKNDPAAAKIPVHLTSDGLLSDEDATFASTYAASLINPLRKELGNPEYIVNKGSVAIAQDIAKDYQKDKFNMWTAAGHDEAALNKEASDWDCDYVGESWAGDIDFAKMTYQNGHWVHSYEGLTRNDLQRGIYNSIISLLFEDVPELFGHSTDILGVRLNLPNGAPNGLFVGGETLGVSFDHNPSGVLTSDGQDAAGGFHFNSEANPKSDRTQIMVANGYRENVASPTSKLNQPEWQAEIAVPDNAAKAAQLDQAAAAVTKAQGDVKTAQDNVAKAKTALTDAQGNVKTAQSALDNAKAATANAQKTADTSAQVLAQKQSALQDAQKAVDAAQHAYDLATADAATKAQALKDAQAKLAQDTDTLTKAQSDAKTAADQNDAAQAVLKSAQATEAQAKEALQQAQDKVNALQKSLDAIPTSDLNVLNTKLAAAQKTADKTQAALDQAQKAYDQAQQTAVASAKAEADAQQVVKDAQSALQQAKSHHDSLVRAQADLQAAQDKLKSLKAANAKAQADLATAKDKLDVAKDALDASQTKVDRAQKRLDQLLLAQQIKDEQERLEHEREEAAKHATNPTNVSAKSSADFPETVAVTAGQHDQVMVPVVSDNDPMTDSDTSATVVATHQSNAAKESAGLPQTGTDNSMMAVILGVMMSVVAMAILGGRKLKQLF